MLGTTNMQTLTIGGSDTGNLVLDGGSGVVRVADLATNGVVYTSNTNGTLNTEAQLSVTRGGTGVNTFGGTNTLLYTTAADSLASLATANNGALITDGTGVPSFSTAGANQILRSNGGGTLAFGSIDLSQSNSVGSSILGVANGGTGADLSSSNAQGSVPFFSSGGVLTSLAPGAAGYVLTTNDTGADPTWVDASSLGTNYLQRNLGTIAPVNITDDLLLGGIATSSARFAFINNIGAGTPTASISANSGNNALYITGGGVLGTTNMQTLTIGGSDTGNVEILGDTSFNGTLTLSNYIGNNAILYTDSSTGVLTALTTPTPDLCLVSSGSNTPTWGSCSTGSGSGGFGIAGALTYQINTTTDLVVGGSSTESAKFAVIGVNTNTPIASISSQNANGYAMFLDPANGSIQTLRNQTLTLGGSTTGDIALSGFTNNQNSVLYTDANGAINVVESTGNALCLLSTNGGGAPTWGTCTGDGVGTNYWQLNGAVLSPGNLNTDLTLGAISTNSAKFAFINAGSSSLGTPTASISANSGNNATIHNW